MHNNVNSRISSSVAPTPTLMDHTLKKIDHEGLSAKLSPFD